MIPDPVEFMKGVTMSRKQQVRRLLAETAELRQQLTDANRDCRRAKADTLREELETYGLAFSRLGIGLRTAGWPFVELVIGGAATDDLRVCIHARDMVRRGMYPLLQALLGFERSGDGRIDGFDITMEPGDEPVPRV